MARTPQDFIPREADAPNELDFSLPGSDEAEALARDRVPVRSMQPGDLDAIASIDRRLAGRDRREWLAQRLDEALGHSDVRVSLVAELDGLVAGFVMARVDLGAFGAVAPVGVLDVIGVDPAHSGSGIGRALVGQLLLNLRALQVERLRSLVRWNDTALVGFLDSLGFTPAPRLALTRKV